MDVRIRNALAPILEPIVDTIYRQPATADTTAVAFGTGSPLVRSPRSHQHGAEQTAA